MQSMEVKRFKEAVVDAVTAEDIGKFPDKNVAETLSRITGVAVSREFGEGEAGRKSPRGGFGIDWLAGDSGVEAGGSR